ncbi:SDR family NAD(P)-dependent oxidoreductase [Solimonas sp. K1W22B-7]|uniref:SDR family NAD(P)-dependent oxidoreductase n=1 Tax=Solimonas sp. K1W22B-7 TaxID=2303331 RepID=UPI000E32D9BE|nr:SDR family NAD(P)-dependent oxidoreductase [Solimonas sp. K1W22B-7]AXQ29802.1 SDR family NAD(P)-dependent oxidoreductase [Solimonas sp. K1W22B-7]
MKQIRGKVALVTGASMGIGAAVARQLAQEGCKVALLARGREGLDQVAAEIRAAGGVAGVYPCDANDAAAVAAAVGAAAAELGPVAILVNNAGAGTFKPLDRMTLPEAMLTVNLPFGAAVAASHSVVPGMIARGEGHIVNLTSPASYFPLPYMVPYTASRHAIMGLSLSLREELERHGVGVSLVCPSKVDTGYFERNDADFRWYPRMSSAFPTLLPERVAREVVRAIRGNKREHIFPFILWLTVRVFQKAPRLNLWFMKAIGLFRPARTA